MKVLKICVVVLFMIISFTTIVNASQEDNHSNLTPSILPELDMSGLNKDIELIEVDPEIMNATPEWIVLVHDDVGKSSWIEDIDRSELSPEEKNTIKNSLINLWNTYPVKTVDGGEKTIELTSQTDGSNEIVTVPIGHVTYIQFDREKIIQAALNKNSIQATKLQTLSSLSVISLSEAENQTIKNLTKLRSKLYKKEQGSQRQNLSQYYSSQSVTPKISFPASDSFSSGFSIPSSYSDDSIYPSHFINDGGLKNGGLRAWGGDPGVSPHGSHSSDPNNYFGHNSFVYWACINHGFPLPYNAADVATEPDGWPQDVTESVILPLTDEQKTGFEAVIHSWDHYYNPDWDTGFAPSFTYYWAYLARGNYTSNQLSSALYLGWASHFLTDVSNPEHTGFEFEQYADKLLGGYNTHVAYEGYVSAMWNQTHPGQTGISTFHQIVKNQVNINYRITNPNTATKNIAKFSHAYLPTLYYRIANQPYIDSNHRGFYDDATVGRITDNCLRVAARYTGGLVDYTQSHTINEIPIADFTANPVFLLSGGTVQFLDKTQYSGPLTTHVDWNFGDGLAHYTADPPYPYTAVNPVHPYTTPGVYTVNLTVSNANGVTSKTMDIGVGNWPTANFDTEAVVAEPAYTYHFTDKSTNTPNHWTWDFGDGSTSTEQNPTHKFDSIHNYDITLVASNIAGPGKVTKTIIPISSKPVAFFIIACGKNGPAPLVTQFMDNSIGWIESRTWDFGDNTTSNEKDPTHIYNKTGIYTVKLTVVSIGAGTSTNTSTISVTPPYPPLAKFTASPRSGPAPLTVRFTDTSTGLPNTWLWNFGDGNGTNATERNPVHTYYTNGSFNASLTATNVGGSNTITKQKYICVGDCRERVGIYQDGSWYIDLNGDGMYNTGDRNAGFGAPLWAPVLGDWNGDGTREIGVYRDGSWYLDYDNSGSWNVGDKNYGYGAINWAPVVGDWSGTGSDKVGAYQDGAWYLDSNGNGVFDAGDKNYAFGGAGWTPVVGRWTSDGKTKIGVYRDGTYYIDYNGDGIYNAGDKTIVYGTSGSTAITGDWNGDGLTEVGTQGGNIWKLDYDGLGAVNASTKTYTFGSPGWSPVVGDWNADGRSKIGIYQNGSWYLDYNGDGVYSSDDKNYALGTAGWMPVTGKW